MNPLRPSRPRHRDHADATKLYGSIVAQARLPAFYQSLAVPDTLQGRFLVLSLHLFAVLHRLKGEGPEGLSLAQELSNRFSEDMETVLREIGVGDISIPKKMRGLAASSGALLQAYDEALASGEQALASAIAGAFPLKTGWLEGATRPIARYVMGMVRSLEAQPLAALRAGEVDFSGPMPGPAGR